MTARLLQAVPNFSEGRDLAVVGALADAAAGAGAEVFDWSADPDHHRSVITLVGEPAAVEEAVLKAAHVARERIDLRRHHGVHPRIGALDVLPLVPLMGMSMAEARRCAQRVGERIGREVGLPVFYYAEASHPPGRRLAELRRGGFEALRDGWPVGREPDVLPDPWPHRGAHPTAGAVCVGARPPLLAWNVYVAGIDVTAAHAIAARLREAGGGPAGVRALGLLLPGTGRLQISMNLEDLEATSPLAVFRLLEALVSEHGGTVEETEVVGMLPDRLVLEAAADRLRLSPVSDRRLQSKRVADHLARPTATRESSAS
jgi:glutamate formiminotransferase